MVAVIEVFDELSKLDQAPGMLIASMVFVGVGFPLWDRSGFAMLVEEDDDGQSVCYELRLTAVRLGGGDVDAGADDARASVNDSCGDFDDVADDDGPVETDPGDAGRDDLHADPIGSAHVGLRRSTA